MPKLYSEQFKADAVALVESGVARRQVCADLGISRSSLQKWITDARLQAQGMQPCADQEMRQALKRIRELEMENEVLRAAAAYLSQEVIRPKGSSRPWKS
ncbi:transposase-like protein [Corynebacterium diphtheriae CDCE 8392]|nr:transposase-like protein [Corynebacterium diphtheriae CDCE 8392]